MSPADDALLAKKPIDPAAEAATAGAGSRPMRFTSNIVGPIILLTDLACLVLSVPIALIAYNLLVGDEVIYSVHVFAFAICPQASF